MIEQLGQRIYYDMVCRRVAALCSYRVAHADGVWPTCVPERCDVMPGTCRAFKRNEGAISNNNGVTKTTLGENNDRTVADTVFRIYM